MNEKNSGTFTLINDKTGEKYTLPVIDGTTGPSVIDVRTLYGETAVSYTHLTLPTKRIV